MSDAPKKVSTKIWRPILEKLEECVIHPNTTTQSDPNPTSHSG